MQFNIRPFREADAANIRALYAHAMSDGPLSPLNLALKHQTRKPISIALYTLFTLGLGISLDRRFSLGQGKIAGAILSTASLGLFLAWRRNIYKKFKAYFEMALKGDLADIRKSYYGITQAQESGVRDEKKQSASGFWVAEVVSEGEDNGLIVGCVGLDASTTPDTTTAELRRMVVSPAYQRHGIGSLLITHVLEHSREYGGLTSLSLSTSMYQQAAMRLYERFGFTEEKLVLREVKFLFITDKATLHFYRLHI